MSVSTSTYLLGNCSEIAKAIGHIFATKSTYKSGFYSGDPNIYSTENRTGYVSPVTTNYSFENRIKACPSVFSFNKVPKGVKVFEYPYSRNIFMSDRLRNSSIDILKWDQMNSRLGPIKKVNVILVNFEKQSSDMAHYQEAAWIGGKKNDLVLCYGTDWSYVFGWTEEEIVKRNLEKILLDNSKDDSIIPKIEEEIIKNYKIKERRLSNDYRGKTNPLFIIY